MLEEPQYETATAVAACAQRCVKNHLSCPLKQPWQALELLERAEAVGSSRNKKQQEYLISAATTATFQRLSQIRTV